MQSDIFDMYVKEYGFEVNEMQDVFTKLSKQRIKELSINLYSSITSGWHTLLMRNEIKNPFVENNKDRCLLCQSDKDKVVIADIPYQIVLKCISKKYSEKIYEYLIMLEHDIYYDLFITI